MVQMLLLAGPGVLISTFCLGTALKFAFPYGWNWKTSLLLGGLLSATDPVAVVALLKDLGASKKLSTIIEGESLMNDGTAIVVYQLFYQMMLGRSFSAWDIVKFLSQVSLGAVAMGLAFGMASVLWLGFIFNDTVIEIALTLAVSYLAYFTAQDGVVVSGVLTVMTLGMFYAAVAKTAFKGDGQQSLHHFWEMVAYIANTLVFILSGVVIAEGVLDNSSHFERHGTSWGYLILLYVFVQLSRLIVVGSLYPFLRYFGYGLDWKEAIILVWSGLRGAVALSLSLSVKVRILNYTRYEMLSKALEAFGDLRDDEELGPADWPTVQRYITCLNNLDEGQVHPHMVSESEYLKATNLRDIRVRLLNGVQAAYWGMLEEGRITQNTASLLMRSIDEAMDVVSTQPLCDWKGLKSNVHFPGYYRFVQMSKLPRRLVTYFTVERLESACYICAAFLRAHRTARRQLHDFIGDSEIATIVINESQEEGEEAVKFLEDVRVTFPQVLRVVKTRQVTYSILKHLSDYVQNLEKIGLLEEKEMVQLDDAVQTDLKKLLRNPPLVKMPKVGELLRTHPLLGALPSAVREPFEVSTKEIMKMRGLTLYKEGSKPNGIWLISVGVVKWTSKRLSNRHSLHPVFSHGSTLGLYEVLVGRPYICDMITDSVVHCLFLETEKIKSLLMTDHAIEDFMWQESAIIIAKLLYPQKFEKMSMHELRGLVAERSTMNIHIQGEVIEIRPHSIGFLLEGFVKTQDSHQDLFTSPSVLLPSQADLDLSTQESPGVKNASFCHKGSWYQVETRVRVIIFDISTTESEGALLKRSAPRLSTFIEPPRNLSRDHEGLLSWPENLLKSRQHQSFNEGDRGATNLSAKAMELSIYGSMVADVRRHYRSSQRTSQLATTHSLSYPCFPSSSGNARPLLSVQSEGGSMNKRVRLKVSSIPPLPATRRKAALVADNSSDESGGEEVVVRVDSPSTLSFHHEGS